VLNKKNTNKIKNAGKIKKRWKT